MRKKRKQRQNIGWVGRELVENARSTMNSLSSLRESVEKRVVSISL